MVCNIIKKLITFILKLPRGYFTWIIEKHQKIVESGVILNHNTVKQRHSLSNLLPKLN